MLRIIAHACDGILYCPDCYRNRFGGNAAPQRAADNSGDIAVIYNHTPAGGVIGYADEAVHTCSICGGR